MVTAVVVLLASLVLYVSLSKFRDRVQLVQCQHNLRASGLAMQMYIAESNNHINSMLVGGIGSVEHQAWGNQVRIRGYLDREESFSCPEGAKTYIKDPLRRHLWYWQTYGLNMPSPPGIKQRVTEPGKGATLYSYNITEIYYPERYVLLADSTEKNTYPFETFRISEERQAGIHLRHREKANLLFLDGHLETLNMYEVERLSDEQVRNGGTALIVFQ